MKNEESAPVNLQQTSVDTAATSATGYEMTLVFDDQRRGEKGQQGTAKKRRKPARKGEGMHHEIGCKGRRPIAQPLTQPYREQSSNASPRCDAF
jgi:hypothetical protein